MCGTSQSQRGDVASGWSSKFRAEKIIARQTCFRPATQDGLPLIGGVPGAI